MFTSQWIKPFILASIIFLVFCYGSGQCRCEEDSSTGTVNIAQAVSWIVYCILFLVVGLAVGVLLTGSDD